MVEFDPAVHAALSPVIEHNASAPNMAYLVHAASAPMVEYDAALMMAHQAHATPAPMVEYDATLMMAHQAHATPAPMVEYDAAPTLAHWVDAAPATVVECEASAARAAPPPLVDGPVVKVVHVPQVQVVEKTIEIPQLQTFGKIVDILEAQSVQSTQTSESLGIIKQNVNNASITRSPRGRSLSGKMARLPCKDYLKGTCTTPFCEKLHPPECLFYKSENGCGFGEKCAVAMLKIARQMVCVSHDMEPPKSSSTLRKSSNITEVNPMCKMHKSRCTSR